MSRGGSKETWASGAILEEAGSSKRVAVCVGNFEWRVIAIESITTMYAKASYMQLGSCSPLRTCICTLWRETRSYAKLLSAFTSNWRNLSLSGDNIEGEVLLSQLTHS